jgi:hypothetical protein
VKSRPNRRDAIGIRSIEFNLMSPAAAHAGWIVIFGRAVRELRGQSCVDLEDVAPAKQSSWVYVLLGKAD